MQPAIDHHSAVLPACPHPVLSQATLYLSHCRMAALTASGCSKLLKCPQFSTITNDEFGASASISRCQFTGHSASSCPTSTSVGHCTHFNVSLLSGRLMVALACRINASLPIA